MIGYSWNTSRMKFIIIHKNKILNMIYLFFLYFILFLLYFIFFRINSLINCYNVKIILANDKMQE